MIHLIRQAAQGGKFRMPCNNLESRSRKWIGFARSLPNNTNMWCMDLQHLVFALFLAALELRPSASVMLNFQDAWSFSSLSSVISFVVQFPVVFLGFWVPLSYIAQNSFPSAMYIVLRQPNQESIFRARTYQKTAILGAIQTARFLHLCRWLLY